MAASPDSEIAFIDEERAMYAELRRHPELQKQIFNMMSADLAWTERDYKKRGANSCTNLSSASLVDNARLAHAHTGPSVLRPGFTGHGAPHMSWSLIRGPSQCSISATLMACS